MKLNYDCVRDVLLELEKSLLCKYSDGRFIFDAIELRQLKNKLPNQNYTIEDVFYTVYNLEQAKYINACPLKGNGQIVEYLIYDITYEGHQFIEQIRPKTVWDKSKSVF